MNDFEPLFRSQIPERTSEAFSRQWYAKSDLKPASKATVIAAARDLHYMLKVDRTRKKMAELLRRVTVLGSENVIPEWLYSSLFEYIQWIMSSTGVHKISMDISSSNFFNSSFPTIEYVYKTQKIYPKSLNPTREDWDGTVFGVTKGVENNEYCLVMPSSETVKWLNEINSYCNELDEWAKGTYLQTQTKLAESKQFLKNIHAQWIVSGNVYMTEEEVRRGLGL